MWRTLGILTLVVFYSFAVGAQDTTTSPDYYVEVFLDNPTPYIGQQIIYSFRFYDAVGAPNSDYQPPDFEGFWRISNEQVETSVQQVNNRQYTVSELNTALYSTQIGDITIEPGNVVLPETVYRSEVEIVTESLNVRVHGLPDGAPEDFSGAVGQFELTASLDHQSVLLGEPLTLWVSVSGTGNVEQLLLPPMPVPSQWRIYNNPTSFSFNWLNGQIVGEKVYEYVLFSDVAGSQMLPSITLSYFDPTTITYRSVSTVPVTIEILPPSNNPTQPVVTSETSTTILSLKPISGNILNQTVYPSSVFWILWFFPPLGVAICGWYVVHQKRRRKNQDGVRHSHALLEARKQLRTARQMHSEKTYPLLRKIIFTYLEDKLNQRHLRRDHSDMLSLLEYTAIPSVIRERVEMSISWIDESQYAPVAPSNLAMLITRIEETLEYVDKRWSS